MYPPPVHTNNSFGYTHHKIHFVLMSLNLFCSFVATLILEVLNVPITYKCRFRLHFVIHQQVYQVNSR